MIMSILSVFRNWAVKYVFERIKEYSKYIYLPYVTKVAYKGVFYTSKYSKKYFIHGYEKVYKEIPEQNFEGSYEFISNILANIAAQEVFLKLSGSNILENRGSAFGRILGSAYVMNARALSGNSLIEPVNKYMDLLPPKVSLWLSKNSVYIAREYALHQGYGSVNIFV